MVESELIQSTKVVLRLDEEETKWLKGIMQNPIRLSPCNPEAEAESTKQMRYRFWKALGGE